jgi:large repetitive protein
MMKRIGRPILLCVVAVAGIVSTTVIASAAATLNTTTTISQTSPAGNPVVGQAVTYVATVAISPTGGGQDPTGTVTFTDLPNSTPGCGAVSLVPQGNPANAGTSTATCTTTYTKVESDNVSAVYGGDSNYITSTSPNFPQTVNQGSTTTTIGASTTTPVTGQSVVFTATEKAVTGTAATPTGTVAFTEAGGAGDAPVPASCATAALSGSGGTATATCTIVFGASGSTAAQLHAAYPGDTNFTGSADVTDATIAATGMAATRVIITPSVSPSVSGQPVTYTAQVVTTAPGSGTPTGTVTFSGPPGCAPAGPTTLSAGSASCTVPAGALLAGNSAADNTTTASYSGASGYTTSSSTFTQSVNQNTTTTTLIASPAKPAAGGPLTLTALVLNPPPGSGSITGNVTFVISGKNSGPLSCSTISVFGGGSASNINNIALPSSPNSNEVTCSLSSVPANANPLKVSVTYAGDPNYFGSASKTTKIKLS